MVYCQSAQNNGAGFGVDNVFANTILATNSAIGITSNGVSAYLNKYGSPTGTIKAVVYNSSHVLIHTYETKNVSDLPVLSSLVEFVGADYLIAEDDIVGIECNGSGASMREQFSGVVTAWKFTEYNGTSWSTVSGRAFTICVLTAVPVSTGSRLPPPPIVLGRF